MPSRSPGAYHDRQIAAAQRALKAAEEAGDLVHTDHLKQQIYDLTKDRASAVRLLREQAAGFTYFHDTGW